jgi:hypothetical protein
MTCDRWAEWEIREVRVSALHPSEGYTHACTEHVGALLSDTFEHRVTPLVTVLAS